MPSLSYSELVGLLIAGALVLSPLAQTDPVGAQRTAAPVSSASGTHARFTCSRAGDA